LLRHESTAVTSRGLNSWWRGVERSIARKVGRRAAPELRGQAGRRGRRTPHGTRATDEEGSEHETVMYIGVCGAENFEVTGHVRTEGGHEGSLPPELTYTNVNAHRHVPDPALSSSPREAAHESSRFFFFGYGGRREAAASDARARRTGRRLDSLAETVSNHQPLHSMKIDGGKEAAAIEACARRRRN
jgi:hypothetical protein